MESDLHYACSVARGFMMERTILLFNATNSSLFGAHFFFFSFSKENNKSEALFFDKEGFNFQ